MQDTDSDLLFEGLPPEEAKRLRRILAEWRIGDEHSFPVQLALLTRATVEAAAQTPLLLAKLLELLDRKLGAVKPPATLLKNFNTAADTKVATEEVIADHREAAERILADLRGHTATPKRLLGEIEDH